MKFLDGAIILAFITAFLFCASTAFTHGFLDTFHLDADVLDRDFHIILYDGFLKCIFPIVVGPFLLLVASVARSALILELSGLIKKSKFKFKRRVYKTLIFLNIRRKKINEKLVEHHYRLNIRLGTIALFAIVFLCMMWRLENKGTKAAELIIESIKNNTYVEVDSLAINRQGLAFLYCASRNCAGVDVKTKEIVYFPQEGHVIRRKAKP